MEERFRERLLHVTEEFARELTNNKDEMVARHKKQIGIFYTHKLVFVKKSER